MMARGCGFCVRRSTVGKLLLLGLLAPLLSTLARAETIQDTRRGFTLTLPDGFRRGEEPEFAYFFIREATGKEPRIHLAIEDLNQVLPQEVLTQAQMPPGFKGTLFKIGWQGLMVYATEIKQVVQNTKMVVYCVSIPLKPGAIQVVLCGPAGRAAELKAMLPTILEQLHGESNWSPSGGGAATSEPRSDLLIIMGLVFVGGLVALWWVSERGPKGTFLGLSAALYALTWMTPPAASRETLALSGTVRLLAFIGIVLGLLGMFRPRRRKRGSEYR